MFYGIICKFDESTQQRNINVPGRYLQLRLNYTMSRELDPDHSLNKMTNMDVQDGQDIAIIILSILFIHVSI